MATAVRRAAPFADPDWHLAWSGDLGMVWMWSREELMNPGGDDSLSDGSMGGDARPVSYIRRFIPESLLRGEARAEGLELLQCAEGVEARAWRGGALYASRWWPHKPDSAQWQDFCRGAGMPPHAVPAVQQAEWRETPWSAMRSLSLRDTLSRYQRLAVPVALAIVLLFGAWQAGSLLRLQLATMQVNSDIEARSRAVSATLDARNHAETDLTQVHWLLGLRPPATQIALMHTVTTLLDSMHGQIVQWTMPNPDTLEVVVAMRAPDPRALVLAFQKTQAFDQVGADVSRGNDKQIVIRARVRAATTASDAAAPTPGGAAS